MVFNKIKFKIYNETEEDIKKYEKELKEVLKYALEKENLKDVVFNVIIVDNSYIHRLNKEYRGIDRVTDVISFALEDEKNENYTDKRILGDIYISLDKAKEQAKEYRHSLDREICFLAVHGLLHLLGYDHQNKEYEKIMFAKQKEILDGKRFTNLSKKQKKF